MRICLLGGLEVFSPLDQPVRFATRKTSLLFAALVLAGRKGLRRETICEVFWPGRGDAQSRNSLRQALVDIRHSFPAGNGSGISLDGDLETVTLKAEPGAADIWAFNQAIERGSSCLASAADLYRGDVLQGIALTEEAGQWFAPHQTSYRRKALHLVESLSHSFANDISEVEMACERLAERLLTSDPAAEEAHRALIRLYHHRNQPNAAHRQFLLCQEALQRELGVEPEAMTRALIEARNAEEAQSDAGPIATAPVRANERPSIVILPFENLGERSDDVLAEGIVEEITATLSRVRDFFVIARQSARTYRGRSVDMREIGRELGVEYAVEGTVRRAGDRVRVFVQLIDTESRTQLWSGRYDRAAVDIFALQDEIAAQVAGAVHPALLQAEIETAKRLQPDNLRAYELVLRAYPKLWSAVAEENREAIDLLRRAIAIDPNYGRAHALLAWCYSQNVIYLWSRDPEADRARAVAAVAVAARLAGNDPMTLTALGAAISQCVGDQDRAAAYIDEALALDPNSAWAWARAGWIAIYRERPATAKENFERAIALSPFDPLGFNFELGIANAHGFAGDHALAARLIQRMLDKNPQVTWAYRQLAAFAALAGDLQTARAAMSKLQAANPGVSIAVMKVSHPQRDMPHFDLFVKGWRLAGLPEE